MLRLKAESFYGVTSRLVTMRARVSELMRKETEEHSDGSVTIRVTTDVVAREYMTTEATELLENLRTLGTRTTLMSAQRLLDLVSDPDGFFWSSAVRLAEEIDGRLKDELSLVTAFVLEPAKAEMYEPASPLFGAEVAAKFPSLGYEIEEAGRCLALSRSTAAAFHAIRCLEAAVLALSRCLRIPDPIKAADRNWGAMLRLIKAEVDRRWPTSTDRLNGDGQIFDELYGSLAGMQNPYRNATMHLDRVYTDEDADDLFGVVRGITRRVASRCDEEGEPKLP